MRARNYYAHPNIRDHWALRCMNRCPDLGVCLKRDLQCLRPQASLILTYRLNVAGMKGRDDLSQPVNRTQDLCAVYKNDIEFVRSLVKNALEKSKQEAEKNEREAEIQLEKIKLSQIEKQLELAKVRKESEKNSQSLESGEPSSITDKLESLVKSIKTLTIQVPVRSESLFFQSLEKAFQIKSVPDELKAEILLNILGERVNNLLTYVSQEDLSNYVKIKELILREFEPMPQECLSNIKKARKLPSENYVQFASRLSATFDYYCVCVSCVKLMNSALCVI
ncbi:DUF1758 domain-containing protein [Trichonephila clavipes]|nr:DUF1758 domain-containing protein [Trichonephila clavipes]